MTIIHSGLLFWATLYMYVLYHVGYVEYFVRVGCRSWWRQRVGYLILPVKQTLQCACDLLATKNMSVLSGRLANFVALLWELTAKAIRMRIMNIRRLIKLKSGLHMSEICTQKEEAVAPCSTKQWTSSLSIC